MHDEDGNVRWFRQPTCEALEYAIVIASRRTGADEVEYVYQVASSIDGEDWLNMAISYVRSAVEEGFDIALKELGIISNSSGPICAHPTVFT